MRLHAHVLLFKTQLLVNRNFLASVINYLIRISCGLWNWDRFRCLRDLRRSSECVCGCGSRCHCPNPRGWWILSLCRSCCHCLRDNSCAGGRQCLVLSCSGRCLTMFTLEVKPMLGTSEETNEDLEVDDVMSKTCIDCSLLCSQSWPKAVLRPESKESW